jgi:hypothetical protein
MRIYTVDYPKVILSNLATFLRKVTRVNWLYYIIYPIIQLYYVFLDFRSSQLYKMSHNSQVVYLRKVLNDRFDNSQRGIEVKTVAVIEPQWHYDTADNKPVWYYDTADDKPVWFRDKADFDNYNADFEVRIPLRLKPDTADAQAQFETKVRLLVDYYKLYSKKYLLKYY